MLDGVVANMVVAVELIQKAIEPMIAKKFGRIVNITSGSVKMPIAGLDLSSGARAGLTAFLAGVARSVAAANVTINFILPGMFDTDRLRSNVESTAKKKGISYEAALAERIAAVPAQAHRQSRRARRRLRVPLLGAGRLHHRTKYSHRRRHISRRVLALIIIINYSRLCRRISPMPASYALGTQFERLVAQLVKSGRYNSKSEVVREGLRLLLDREQERDAKIAALREAFRQGEESGLSDPRGEGIRPA